MLDVAAEDFPQTVVAPHPPYTQVIAGIDLAARSDVATDTFARVDALRPNKGAQSLIPLAEATTRPWRLRVIGPDWLSAEIGTALAANQVQVQYSTTVPPSDEELVRLLYASAALIAPYTAPTASGSVYIALTLRVPVLGLVSPSFADLVSEKNQASDVAALIDNFRASEWRSAAGDLGSLSALAADAWAEVVRGA